MSGANPKRARWYRVFCAVLGLGLLGSACGDDDGNEEDDGNGNGTDTGASCEESVEKMRSCDLLSGEADCSSPLLEVFQDRCVGGCFDRATCEDIELAVCAGLGGPFLSCFQSCGQFTCGDGTRLSPIAVCDGVRDCFDNSDEEDCVWVSCADGSAMIPEIWLCDGFLDCADGGDEAECPTFDCGDGTIIPISWQCDTEADCADGSDEAGCPEGPVFCPTTP